MSQEHIDIVGDGEQFARECKRFADLMVERADRIYHARSRTLRLGRLHITWKKRRTA